MRISSRHTTHCNTLQHAATHCNALQRTATHRNALQHAHSSELTSHIRVQRAHIWLSMCDETEHTQTRTHLKKEWGGRGGREGVGTKQRECQPHARYAYSPIILQRTLLSQFVSSLSPHLLSQRCNMCMCVRADVGKRECAWQENCVNGLWRTSQACVHTQSRTKTSIHT